MNAEKEAGSGIPECKIEFVKGDFQSLVNGPAKSVECAIAKGEFIYINGVPAISGDSSVDISGMEEIITRNKVDAIKLRKEGWQRNMW